MDLHLPVDTNKVSVYEALPSRMTPDVNWSSF